MRRSHLLLASAVAIAGVAALVGNRRAPAAQIEGAPLSPAAGSAVAAAVAVDAPPADPADLLDLDQIALADGGDHYETTLRDGRRAVLTLDPGLQAYAEKLLTEARAPRGAIVAMAPDGRILALAGRRSDPPAAKPTKTAHDGATPTAAFDWRIATEVWAPAASVFKLVTASALVAAGVDPSDKVCFHGGLRSVLESNLRDDKRDARCESLTYGVAHSNNAILGKLAFQKLEPAQLAKCAHELGVADPLPAGAELRGAAGAIDIPSLRDLSFAQTAAGFSGSQLSAVGGALLAATFADGGEQPAPRLISTINGVAPQVPAARRALAADVAKAVGQMMVATCEFGSAAKSFGRHQIRVAGKTGTLTRSEPFYMEHSWFVGYAPAEKPEIIVSVVLGNPENWHLRGHEAARRLIDHAIGREKDRTAKITATRRVGW